MKKFLIEALAQHKALNPTIKYTLVLINDSFEKKYRLMLRADKFYNKIDFIFEYESTIHDIIDTFSCEVLKAKDYQ